MWIENPIVMLASHTNSKFAPNKKECFLSLSKVQLQLQVLSVTVERDFARNIDHELWEAMMSL